MRHIIPISGKDSLATAIVQNERQPLNYEFMFNPTGAELPEVFEWIKKVESYFGKEIIQVGANLENIIESFNYFLPSRRQRYCTRMSKIEPMLKFIGDEEATIYYGIRADENRQGFNNSSSPHIKPVYPLVELGIGINLVYKIINAKDLKPPVFFWHDVYEQVKSRLDFDPKERLPEHLFDMLFSWRSRANCFFCFNQRQYEYIGLLEHHPELFEKAEWYETKGYNWRDHPLSWYKGRKDEIKEKRIKALVKSCRKIQQLNLFELEDEKGFFDVFKVTSCGLFCGK